MVCLKFAFFGIWNGIRGGSGNRTMAAVCRVGVLLCLPVVAVAGPDAAGSVRLLGSAWIGDAPTKVAAGRDWFNQGIDPTRQPWIEVLSADSGYQALQQLRSGEVEFALAATTPVAGALLAGQPAGEELVVLASLGISNRTHYLLADADKGIREPADLAGRRVGVMHGTSGHFGWSRFALFQGLQGRVSELVDAPISELGAMLIDGQLDAAVIWEPWGSTTQLALGDRARTFSMRQLYSVNWLLVSRRSVLAEYPGLAERILGAYQKALTDLEEAPRQQLRWHAQAVNLPVDEILPQAEHIIWHLGLDWSVLTNMQVQLDWLADQSAEPRPELLPRDYLDALPLWRVAPGALAIPVYMFCAEQHQECRP